MTTAPSPNSYIAIVDDDAAIRSALGRALRMENYDVELFEDGVTALKSIQLRAPDAIVLDLQLPDIDGLEICRRIRRSGDSTPILMLTARDAVNDRVAGLDVGADDYLVKPFDLAELLARVRALIRRGVQQPSPEVSLGEVRLDLAARRVTRLGAPVALTAKEYLILEYLALNRGRLVTRSALYEHVFDENDDTLSNLIDVHVSNLRKKLGHDLITTRRGLGYCIE